MIFKLKDAIEVNPWKDSGKFRVNEVVDHFQGMPKARQRESEVDFRPS